MSALDLVAIARRHASVAKRWTLGTLGVGVDELGPRAFVAHGPLRVHQTALGRVRAWRQTQRDAEFLAHAVEDVGALLAEVARLRALVEAGPPSAERVDESYAFDVTLPRCATVHPRRMRCSRPAGHEGAHQTVPACVEWEP